MQVIFLSGNGKPAVLGFLDHISVRMKNVYLSQMSPISFWSIYEICKISCTNSVLTLYALWTWLIYRNFIHYHRYSSLPWRCYKLCLFMSPVSHTWAQALVLSSFHWPTCTTAGVRGNTLYLQVSSKLPLPLQYFDMKDECVLARIKSSCYKNALAIHHND